MAICLQNSDIFVMNVVLVLVIDLVVRYLQNSNHTQCIKCNKECSDLKTGSARNRLWHRKFVQPMMMQLLPAFWFFFNSLKDLLLLGPFHGAIAVPSVTHCRCRHWRRGHRCSGGVRQYSGDTWWVGVRRLVVANGPNIFQMLLVWKVTTNKLQGSF